MAVKILMLLDSLIAGGKERRALELFHYLKEHTNFEFMIVLTENTIHYNYVFDLDVPLVILKKRLINRDPLVFRSMFKIVKSFRPDIIHSWSTMTTFYAIPSAKYFRIPIYSGEVADSVPSSKRSRFKNFIWKINRKFSTLIIANSHAGLKAYNVNSDKGIVIYNGLRLKRFDNLDKNFENKINVNTQYSIVMVASFGMNKDYDLLLEVAKRILNNRDDVTFICIGDGENKERLEEEAKESNLSRFLFTGIISNVEEIVSKCDIGILLTNTRHHGEGISNSVMEYMALSKPVVATNAGGTMELVEDKNSGFLIENNLDSIVEKINNLLDNEQLRVELGLRGREIIENHFTIDTMGKNFVKNYNKVL